MTELGWESILHPDDTTRVLRRYAEAFATREPFTVECRFREAATGHDRWFMFKAEPRVLAADAFVGFVGIAVDIDDQKKAIAQKDDFIAIATHELKTPVTSVKAYAQALQRRFERGGDDRAAAVLAKVDAQLNKLTALIGDLMDATRIESGKLEFHQQWFDLNALVAEQAEELQHTTDRHRIVVEAEPGTPIPGDRERTGQALTNLLSNAIKYSPDGGEIVVRTAFDAGYVTLSVQDFGIGIAKSERDKVFDRFYRAGGSMQDTFPGLGLGLYITAEIVRRQGGRIWVESETGAGSTFCLCLPTGQSGHQSEGSNASEPEGG